MVENTEIKMKLASKLVSMVSMQNNNGEEFFNAMKVFLTNVLGAEEELEAIFKAFREVYSYKDVSEKIAQIYAKHFSEDEMIDIINFYSTPTGQVWIKKHPLVISEIMEVNQKYGASITEEILKRMDK